MPGKDLYRIGITGSYGGMNLGGEAILQSIIAQLRRDLRADHWDTLVLLHHLTTPFGIAKYAALSLGSAGVNPNNAHYLGVGAGDTFIAAIQQKKIAAGMTTYPTISRLVNSGKGKILVSLLSPEDTRAALGGDYPFIGVFAKNDWVDSNKDVTQRLVNAYVKTLKYIHSHTPEQIADQMPSAYYAGDKASYIADLKSQIGIFGTDCKMPSGGPETVQRIQQQFVASYKGKSANLSETYTNYFAENATA